MKMYTIKDMPPIINHDKFFPSMVITRKKKDILKREANTVSGQIKACHNVGRSGSLSELLRYQATRRNNLINKKRQGDQKTLSKSLRIRTPPPLLKREHIPVQTEEYLEELYQKCRRVNTFVQTEPTKIRPPSPVFIRSKVGVDSYTQVYNSELFDFEREVEPILEVLVAKTMQQSYTEVKEEEEIRCIRERQKMFEERRQIEIAIQQDLEERDRRIRDEKKLRIEQERVAFLRDEEMRKQRLANQMAQKYIGDMIPYAARCLINKDHLRCDDEKDIEGHFLPWLRKCVDKEIQEHAVSQSVVNAIIHETVCHLQKAFLERRELGRQTVG